MEFWDDYDQDGVYAPGFKGKGKGTRGKEQNKML
jgi:hypothetical protein